MSSTTTATTTTPCAACKLQRRKCTQECVFAPYFPPDQPQKFETVRNVFGASNVAKLLSELAPSQREDAVNSLAYEAEARLRDPVYGCVGLISLLQHRLKQIQINLHYAKKELATYVGPQAMLPIHLQPQNYSVYPQQQQQQQQQQQMVESQQMEAALAARDQQQELLRQQEVMGFNNNNGFEQMSAAVDSGLWLASSSGPYSFQLEQQLQLQLQSQKLIQQQQQPLQAVIPKEHKWSRGQEEEEGARSIGPSSF